MSIKAASATFLASIIARTWEDDEFKKNLINNPEGELAALGYGDLYDSNGNKIQIKVEDAPTDKTYEPCIFNGNTMTIYLPKKPEGFDQFEFKGQFASGACC